MNNREAANTTPPSKLSKKSRSQIILSLILYAIPLAFFVVCYFLIITSGEDIYQGAHTTPDIIGDSIAAFRHNARLSDMYAWSVINFFDYKYSFGIDTIFRLLDVAMGMGIIYLMTYFALSRRPRLKISDATWFLFCFVMIFLTPHGRTLYAGFSAIHNYLIITLSTLIFLLPFVRLIQGRHIPNGAWLKLCMLVAGFIFGFSSNLTPIAFLITYAIARTCSIIRRRSAICNWEVAGVAGVLIGVTIQYALGPGVTSYINGDYSTTYDYISIGRIFSEPLTSTVSLAKHIIINYGRVLSPLLLVFVVCFTIYLIARKIKQQRPIIRPTNKQDNAILSAGSLFTVVHIAIASQIEFPLRIILPAYIVGVICLAVLLRSMLNQLSKHVKSTFTFAMLLLSIVVVVARFILAISYSQKILPVLEFIKNSSEQSLCISRESINSTTIPLVYLGQESILADWAMPETIYGKTITFCDSTR